MDAQGTWHGRNATLQTPKGTNIIALPPGHAIEILPTRSGAWPEISERDPAGRPSERWQVRGIERDEERRPVFIMETDGVRVREQVVPRLASGGTRLLRRFIVNTDEGRGDLYMRAAVAPVIKAGYDPKSGVEQVLVKDAVAAGKAENALETPEQQIRFFADLPPKTEADFLAQSLKDADEGVGKIDQMVAAWAAGDTKTLESIFVSEMKGDYPALYDLLIVQRNRNWAQQLKTKLAGKGVSFVAVGSGHLVGPDSVQAQLAKLGVTAERVE